MPLFSVDFVQANGPLNPADWEPVTSGTFSFNPLQVAANTAEPTVLLGDDGLAAQVPAVGGADQWAEMTFFSLLTGGSGGVGVRVDAAGGTGYFFSVSLGLPGSWLLYKYTPAYATIASGNTDVVVTSTVRLSVVGTLLRAYVDSRIITATLDADLATGQPGLAAYCTGAVNESRLGRFSSNVISAAITWSRVETIPFLYGGCGIQGVTCLGDAHMLATVEEVGAPTPPGFNVIRPFLSTDNGLTWAEVMPTFGSEANLHQSKIRRVGPDRALAGMSGPQVGPGTYEPAASVIVRTLDAGTSWTSAVSAAEYAADNFAVDGYGTTDFIPTDFGTVFSVGAYGAFGAHLVIMRSPTDGSAFATPDTLSGAAVSSSLGGTYLGDDTVLVGVSAITPTTVYRSTNQGAAWSAVVVGAGGERGSITGACPVGELGSHVGLLCAQRATPSLVPLAWYTTDTGATWAASVIGVTAQGATDVIAASPDYAVLGLNLTSGQMGAGGTPFLLANDGGSNFVLPGTMADAFFPGVSYRVMQFAISDDGAIVAAVQTGDLTNTSPNEIWRGVIDDFAGPGPCASTMPPTPPTPPPPVPAVTQGQAGIFPTRIVAVWRP